MALSYLEMELPNCPPVSSKDAQAQALITYEDDEREWTRLDTYIYIYMWLSAATRSTESSVFRVSHFATGWENSIFSENNLSLSYLLELPKSHSKQQQKYFYEFEFT